jgi:hypothetical protein
MEATLNISGLIITGVIAVLGFGKKLRSDKRLAILFVITCMVAIIGLILRNEVVEHKISNPADSLICPLAYVLCYAGLRQIFKAVYKMEPTYQRYSWYDQEEGRKQNVLDVVVHVFPLMVAIFVPAIIRSLS